jgi:5,5'-dehydrodivanillate O-demethylase
MNERLTRVGPGTPGGELMRRYWIPIAPSAQLDESPVHKVRILCEDLVLYKDTSGKFGLIGDRCLHRNVDLQFGIPDENGLRCPYHGWLFNGEGRCTERPMEATPCGEIKRKLKGYPVRELGGLVFAYMGPLPAPDLPRWDLFVWPNAIRQIGITHLDCNWLQCQENTGDPAHSAWAHGHMFEYAISRQKGFDHHSADQLHTLHQRKRVGVGIKELYAEPSEFGFRKGIRYSKALGADEDKDQEHSAVIFPFYTQTGPAARRARNTRSACRLTTLHPTAGKAASFHKHAFRKYYHRGFGNDDADRYGPIFETVKELHHRIEEYELAQASTAAPHEGVPG